MSYKINGCRPTHLQTLACACIHRGTQTHMCTHEHTYTHACTHTHTEKRQFSSFSKNFNNKNQAQKENLPLHKGHPNLFCFVQTVLFKLYVVQNHTTFVYILGRCLQNQTVLRKVLERLLFLHATTTVENKSSPQDKLLWDFCLALADYYIIPMGFCSPCQSHWNEIKTVAASSPLVHCVHLSGSCGQRCCWAAQHPSISHQSQHQDD